MSRPTREQLEVALQEADRCAPGYDVCSCVTADWLAAEVRALRAAFEGLASITEEAANDFESRNETHSSHEVVVAIAAYGKMIARQMLDVLKGEP